MLENDCGDLAYADVYQVNVSDDLSLEVTHVENIQIFSKMTHQEFIDYVSEQYEFSKSNLEERYLR